MLRQGRGVRLADNVVVAGFPLSGLLSSGLNVTTGAVSALAGPGDDRRLIQITAPVQPGNSGGPLLDASGNVVGVVVSKLDAVAVASVTGDIPQNVNFAISLGTLQAFLDANSIDYQTRASSAPKSNADVAEVARAATVQIECRN
jgi:S1-C subfamily serine protease